MKFVDEATIHVEAGAGLHGLGHVAVDAVYLFVLLAYGGGRMRLDVRILVAAHAKGIIAVADFHRDLERFIRRQQFLRIALTQIDTQFLQF